jgi:hypothetical protein
MIGLLTFVSKIQSDIICSALSNIQAHSREWVSDDWSVNDRDGDSKQSEYKLDLEASWLIVEAAQRLGRQDDSRIRRASLALVDHAYHVTRAFLEIISRLGGTL